MTGERCYEAELHRLRGECVLSLASPQFKQTAEASFQQAIEVARHQNAKIVGVARSRKHWPACGGARQAR